MENPHQSNETIPPYFRPETTITNKSVHQTAPCDIKKTRKLILGLTLAELFLTIPIFFTTSYIFNPRLQSLNGPTALLLTSFSAFFATLFLTIIYDTVSVIFSVLIRKRIKQLALTHDKTVRILQIIFTIVSFIPAILLILGILHIITNY